MHRHDLHAFLVHMHTLVHMCFRARLSVVVLFCQCDCAHDISLHTRNSRGGVLSCAPRNWWNGFCQHMTSTNVSIVFVSTDRCVSTCLFVFGRFVCTHMCYACVHISLHVISRWLQFMNGRHLSTSVWSICRKAVDCKYSTKLRLRVYVFWAYC